MELSKKENFLDGVWSKRMKLEPLKKQTFVPENDLKNLLGKVISVGPYYYYTLDFSEYPNVNMENKNSTISDFFNIPLEEFNLSVLMSRIHPDDINFIQKAEELSFRAAESIYQKNIFNFKNGYCFRIRDKNEEYRIIHHQSMLLEVDSNNTIIKSVNIHTDISHITTINPRTVSFFGLDDALPTYVGLDPYKNTIFEDALLTQFTNRELEIIRFVSSGLSNKNMGERMGISESTVSTHRKNILAKSSCNNFIELVSRLIKEGLI